MKFGALYEDFAKNMNCNSVSVVFLTVIIYMHISHERKNEKLVFVKTAHIIQALHMNTCSLSDCEILNTQRST